MYGSLVTDDTYKRADGIFKSMIEIFNPHLKEYISHGKLYEKNVIEEGKATKASQSSAVKIGIAATLSPGCKDVGKCIMDITDAMQEVSMAQDAWAKQFGNDVLYSMEQRCEQDGKYITGLRKKFQDDFKGKMNEAEKAMTSVTKLKKRSMNKPSSVKADTKLQKTYEKLHSAKAATEELAHEMLNRAFLEERRRYCYFVERQCQAVQAIIEYYETSASILKANLDTWMTVGNSQNDLLPGAIALIESSKSRQSHSDADSGYAEVRAPHGGSSTELSKADDKPNGKEQPMISPVFAQKIDVYNNPYRTASTTSIANDDFGRNQGYRASKNHLNFDSEKLTLPVYASLSRSAEMVFTDETVQFRQKTVSDVVRRHASESVEIVGWSACEDRLESDPPNNDLSEDKHVPSDTDDGDVFELQETDSAKENLTSAPTNEGVEDDPDGTKTIELVEKCYESLYDYLPEANGSKLELRRGDKMTICGSGVSRGGWLYGENMRTNMKGWFPENYCKEKENKNEDLSPTGSSDIKLNKSSFIRNRDSDYGSSRDSRNIFRFSRDLEKTLVDMRKNKNGRQSWQL